MAPRNLYHVMELQEAPGLILQAWNEALDRSWMATVEKITHKAQGASKGVEDQTGLVDEKKAKKPAIICLAIYDTLH